MSETGSTSTQGQRYQALPKDDSKGPPLHVEDEGSAAHSHVSSLHNKSLDEDDWDDDDEDDDDIALRRYHVHDVPLPVEFRQPRSIFGKLWMAFTELQAAARQRRAARLLTLPSQDLRYQVYACLLTSCCDATDRGIALVLVGFALWIFVGVAFSPGSQWWTGGLILLAIRVSARRIWEAVFGRRRRHSSIQTANAVTPTSQKAEGVELCTAGIFRDRNQSSGTKGSTFDESNSIV